MENGGEESKTGARLGRDIAVIGLACRFPQANDAAEFWDNLAEGRDSVREIPPDRWDPALYYSPDIGAPGKSRSRWCGIVDGFDGFDNRYFEISPREAKNMDPQQRLLLEEAVHCIEDSGVPLQELRARKTGVFVGAMGIDYHQECLHPSVSPDSFAGTGNYVCILANRVSYVFGLSGKSFAIDAACASSLVALHEAVRSLRDAECDYALVAGVNLNFHPWKYVTWSKSRMLSADGRCRAFDKDANGYVPGDGVGVLLLQRRDAALAERNRIHGLVRGSALNHGGRGISMTAPSVLAQESVIRAALEDAGVNARSISYVEAHGTGTSLGDPIEVEALTRAYRRDTADRRFARIGSVKSNIGHLEAAAGVAGVIKVLLMMKERRVPKTLHVNTPNPIIAFSESPFELAVEPSEWAPGESPRRAGVSSFGIGGVNAHVVLEEDSPTAASAATAEMPRSPSVFALSAPTRDGLLRRIEGYRRWLSALPEADTRLVDICATATVSSSHHAFRAGGIISTLAELEALLSAPVPDVEAAQVLVVRDTPVAGFDRVRPLYDVEPRFRRAVDALLDRLSDAKGLDRGSFFQSTWNAETERILSCVVSHAFWSTVREYGFDPREVRGDGCGFYVALALSGMLEVEDALALALPSDQSAELAGRSPDIGLHDPVAGILIEPIRVEAKYLESLLDRLEVSDSEVDSSLARARLLVGTQRTYQRYVDEWEEALRPLGIDREWLLEPRERVGMKPSRARLLSFIVFESALRKVSEKWELSRATLLADARADELVQLVVDGALSKEALVALLMSSSLEEIASRLESPGALRAPGRYPILRSLRGRRVEREWAHAAARAEPGATAQPAAAFELGALGSRTDLLLDFDRVLVGLWTRGAPIRWDWRFPAGAYARVGLPPYPFERQTFWIRDRRDDRRALGQLTRSVSVSEPILRDHRIGGRVLVPAALLIDTALQLATQRERVVLSNVVFHSATSVDEQVEIRVERQERVIKIACNGLATAFAEVDALVESERRPPRAISRGVVERATGQSADLYGDLSKWGYEYGESLRLIERFETTPDGCVARLRLKESKEGEALPFALDAVLQAGVLAILTQGKASFAEGRFLPAFIGRADVASEVSGTLEVRARARNAGPNDFAFDIVALGEAYDVVFELENVVYRRAALDRVGAVQTARDFSIKAPVWREAVLSAQANGWVEAGAAIVGLELADVEWFVPHAVRRHGSDLLQELTGDFGRLIESLTQRGGRPTVYFLCGFGAPRASSSLVFDERPLRALFSLVQEHVRKFSDRPLRVVIVSRMAVLAGDHDTADGFAYGALAGFAKTAALESPQLELRLVDLESADAASAEALLAEAFLHTDEPRWVARRGAKRLVQEFASLNASVDSSPPLVGSGKNYLVAGGSGGVGSALLDAVFGETDCQVFVLGRKAKSGEQAQPFVQRRCGLHFLRCDVCDPEQVDRVVRDIRGRFGALHGVVQLAGVLDDRLLLSKSWDSFRHVLEPKIEGTLSLHRATLDHPLDFFLAFSSIVSLIGNPGQADYAAANGFLDRFLEHRARTGAPGKSVVVNWPLWRGVGMGQGLADSPGIERLRPLARSSGSDALAEVFRDQGVIQLVVEGSVERQAVAAPRHVRSRSGAVGTEVRAELETYLTGLIASKLGIDDGKIDPDESLFALGLDSLILQELTAELNRHFEAELPPTLFYEHPNLRKLTGYFEGQGFSIASSTASDDAVAGLEREDESVGTPVESKSAAPGGYEIAVIGMSGRFPGARTLSNFWRNLAEGRDCVAEIPEDRWNHTNYAGARADVGMRSYGRWGGFIEDVDRFDPLFFGISPKEAEEMDPQQRLILECVWEAMEDAGYGSRSRYADAVVGLFVGVMWNEYSFLAGEAGSEGDYKGPGSLYWAIANRVSFFMDFKGPSLALDTACSSSLTAVHLACQSLLAGDCSMALAGGVNLSIHPHKYVYLSQAKFLSSDGRCRSFGEGGDGYVPGEGVGAVVLKPLAAAVSDNDRIYGVIRGTSVNHGGKATGFTVPNPEQQARLIREAVARAKISPRDIGYVECHGTGTALGDPIEIRALDLALRDTEAQSPRCPIGSVKSNIGHLEAAAGVAGLIKVLLALEHRTIPRSLHGDRPNPQLDLDKTRFYVAKRTEPWAREEGRPRIAAISSFGAGGSNAHAIVQEHLIASAEADGGADAASAGPWVLPFSARDQAVLRRVVELFCDFLSSPDSVKVRLSDIAYTLQVGRQAFRERAAFVVADRAEAERACRAYLEQGRAGRADDTIAERLASAWERGEPVDFKNLRGGGQHHVVSLPTYPFRRERYWITPRASAAGPMSTLSASEALVRDHVVMNEPTLPGAYVLALALNHAEKLGRGDASWRIERATWLRPLVVRGHTAVRFEVAPDAGVTRFSLVSSSGAESHRHAEGFLVGDERQKSRPRVDLDALRGRCTKQLSKAECYAEFARLGLSYGRTYQVIETLHQADGEALALIEVEQAAIVGDTRSTLGLSTLLDGAFQAALGSILSNGAGSLLVPFSLGKLEFIRPLPARCCVAIRRVAESERGVRFDLEICDESGIVMAQLSDLFLARVPAAGTDTGGRREDERYYAPVWTELALERTVDAPSGDIVLFAREGQQADAVEARLTSGPDAPRVFRVRPGRGFEVQGRNFTVDVDDPDSFGELAREFLGRGVSPTHLVHLWADGSIASSKERIALGGRSLLFFLQALMRARLLGKCALLYAFPLGSGEPSLFAATSGLLRAARREKPELACACVGFEGLAPSEQAECLVGELASARTGCVEVEYRGGRRLVREWELLEPGTVMTTPPTLRRGASVILTGGAGGLGLIFAEHLIAKYAARVVLMGRSELDAVKRVRLEQLGGPDSIIYSRGDVCCEEDVAACVRLATERYGGVHVVIHAAGTRRDSYLINKTKAEFEDVLKPKVVGTLILDELTQHESLDAFVCFSSVSGVLGNAAQSDYAFANAFLGEFAHSRERLRRRGLRSGRTLTIDWPLWREGGMTVRKEDEALLQRTLGIRALETDEGLRGFDRALAYPGEQVMIVAGSQERIESGMKVAKRDATPRARDSLAQGDAMVQDSRATMRDVPPAERSKRDAALRSTVLEMMARILRVDAADVHEHDDLREYGFDSVSFAQFASALNDRFRLELTPAVFFEFASIAALTEYLNKVVSEKRPLSEQEVVSHHQPPDPPLVSQPAVAQNSLSEGSAFPGIAIVGMSGMLPQCQDLNSLWTKLEAGAELLTGVPEERIEWWGPYAEADPEVFEAAKRGRAGFAPGIDEFDAAFFRISPREADLMDPQHRLFLTTVWKAIEDAGYRMSELWGASVGLFVGVSTSDYAELLRAHRVPVDALTSTGSFHSILANRISFLFNFTGPSEPVDTACSSSLVAIHRAVKALKDGDCEMAIAGGVSLLAAPTLFWSFEQAGMLSPAGRCRTFDKAADGYVRGEGVGAIVLKRLDRALADGDHVYGVIRGTAVGHAGRANSLTAPNPNSQAEVLLRAYRDAAIPAHRVGYIEAHGTGTSLGDPIEVSALKGAFERLHAEAPAGEDRTHRCALGSIKTNIGHLEAAAGIAGVLKVLLALKHRKIPANANFDELNPYIALEGTPFHVATRLEEWPADREPRVAGVSSFGFGGVNAHVVIEDEPRATNQPVETEQVPAIFLVSAESDAVLVRYAQDLLDFVERRLEGTSLYDVAYTTQVGREPMSHRLAILASSTEELRSRLADFVSGNRNGAFAFEGRAGQRGRPSAGVVIDGEEGKLYLRLLAENRKLEKLCQLWAAGVDVDFRTLHEGRSRRRVPLPTYPFEKERHWFGRHVPATVLSRDRLAQLDAPNGASAQESRDGERGVRLTLKSSRSQPEGTVEPVAPAAAGWATRVTSILGVILGVDPGSIPADIPFQALGLDSIMTIRLVKELKENSSLDINPMEVVSHQTVQKLSQWLSSRGAVAEPTASSPEPFAAPAALEVTRERVVDEMRSVLAEVLFVDPEQLDLQRPLVELGLDSVLGLEFIEKMNQRLQVQIKASKLYEYSSLERLSGFVASLREGSTASIERPERRAHGLLFASEPHPSGLGAPGENGGE